MKYFKRAGIYKASNLSFNPETGLGHSYAWYEIAKVIKGVQVLNTYNYSPSTCKHHNKLWRLMRELGFKFITVEAPNGLQSLDAAATHAAYLMGKALVEFNHARKPVKYNLKRAQENIENLERIGVKVSKKSINEAVKQHEELRSQRLAREKRERDQAKERAKAQAAVSAALEGVAV